METSILPNIIWPVFMTIAAISFIDYLLDRNKSRIYITIAAGIIAILLFGYFNLREDNNLFLQLYLFMFLLSISLVILALRKQIDTFTLIGIMLMIVMLILLLRFTLV